MKVFFYKIMEKKQKTNLFLYLLIFKTFNCFNFISEHFNDDFITLVTTTNDVLFSLKLGQSCQFYTVSSVFFLLYTITP